jgi:hypothetical protein
MVNRSYFLLNVNNLNSLEGQNLEIVIKEDLNLKDLGNNLEKKIFIFFDGKIILKQMFVC